MQAAELETVRKWVDVAEKLGASHIRVFGGAVPKGATEDQAVAWAVETLKRAAEEAGKKGIILGVEDDGGITTNADRTVEIVKKDGVAVGRDQSGYRQLPRRRLHPDRDVRAIRHQRALQDGRAHQQAESSPPTGRAS